VKIVVLSNPASGRGRAQHRLEVVRSLAGQQGVDLHIQFTERPGEAARAGALAPGSAGALARAAVESGADLVVAAGGDGTIGEVVHGLLGSSIPLGILPLGTGNDFVRTVGLPIDPEAALQVWTHGEDRRIDVVQGPHGCFLNVAGCGFDAEVALRVNQGYRWVSGTAAYLLAVLETLRKARPKRLHLVIDGQEHTFEMMLCALANARFYGGGMVIAPSASVEDGLMDLVVVGNVSRWEFLRALPRVFRGTHLQHPKVTYLQGRRVELTGPEPLPLLADGETIGMTPAVFEVLPRALALRVPRLT